ncbi:MAG: hypothetical protein F6J89_25010 [Symploca sp. SIO1C4]|uniref:Uncharacterized protein n=1 Tax=Symploca sp. SIO1C4 TaxID=2607765 RepID=A0A6B3NNI8_9CYAN|nr:hypothetical protein [Symploca sp. SIO1C4]
MNDDYQPTLIPSAIEGVDIAVPMSKQAISELKRRFQQDTDTILQWTQWIQDTYDFEFDLAFLCVCMGSLRCYLEAGKSKEEWRKDHQLASSTFYSLD